MIIPAFPAFNVSSSWIESLYFPSPYGHDGFDWQGIAVDTTVRYTWLWAPLVLMYLPVIWSLQRYMERRPEVDVHYLYPLWNLCLGVFSLLGAIHIVPLLVRQVTASEATVAEGLHRSVCNDEILYSTNAYWIWWFNMSKLPEFIDTVLLRLRKRPVIFLHWFHHIVTAVFCIYSNQSFVPGFGCPGGGRVVWFAAMNLLVHSVMYTYYFVAAVGYGKVLERYGINIILTTMQLSQMAMGLYVLQHSTTCENLVWDAAHPKSSNFGYWFGMAMYFAYFVLFAKLFGDKYLWPKPKASVAAVANGTDAAKPVATTNLPDEPRAGLTVDLSSTENGHSSLRHRKRAPEPSPVHPN